MWLPDLVAETFVNIPLSTPVKNFTLKELFLKKTPLDSCIWDICGINILSLDNWYYPKTEINWLFYQVKRCPVYHMHGELHWNILLLIAILLFPWNLHDCSCEVWTDKITLWKETYTWSLRRKRPNQYLGRRIAHQTCNKQSADWNVCF